jgi:prepilin-type processing-associated H-X9-DG protein
MHSGNRRCHIDPDRTAGGPVGFSLVELVVVLGLLAVGVLLIAPTLARTQFRSKSAGCLNNLRRFAYAWTMYAGDSSDRLINNFGINETTVEVNQRTYRNWVNNVMTWGSEQMNTNVQILEAGILSPYLRGDLDSYRCPADEYLSPQQLALGWTSRTRSISMNSLFGRFSSGADATAQGLNWALPQYLQYLKLGRIPKPGKTWLVLDEHPDSVNDGYYINNPTGSSWQDLPAAYHHGGCGFAFADGHAEIRKWLSSASRYPVRYFYGATRSFDPAGRLDFAWYLERTGYINASTGQPAFGY